MFGSWSGSEQALILWCQNDATRHRFVLSHALVQQADLDHGMQVSLGERDIPSACRSAELCAEFVTFDHNSGSSGYHVQVQPLRQHLCLASAIAPSSDCTHPVYLVTATEKRICCAHQRARYIGLYTSGVSDDFAMSSGRHLNATGEQTSQPHELDCLLLHVSFWITVHNEQRPRCHALTCSTLQRWKSYS